MISDIPIGVYSRKQFSLYNLLKRAEGPRRASWCDLPKEPGIYLVRWSLIQPPIFLSNSGKAVYATTKPPQFLQSKWDGINKSSPTDIIYIGKGDILKQRIRLLVRFGVGKRAYHEGGEWIWQISNISTSEIITQNCPSGKQIAFENALLEKYCLDHGDYPLANRKGPEGPDRWMP